MKEITAVSKLFKFACAHRLNVSYDTPCLSLHGHEYYVRVTIYAHELNENQMIIDFNELDKFQDYLNKTHDHATLVYKKDHELKDYLEKNNQKCFVYDRYTTSENIAKKLCHEFISIFQEERENWSKVEVKVWESSKNYAYYALELN